jgi:hypothetical protein
LDDKRIRSIEWQRTLEELIGPGHRSLQIKRGVGRAKYAFSMRS